MTRKQRILLHLAEAADGIVVAGLQGRFRNGNNHTDYLLDLIEKAVLTVSDTLRDD